MEYINLPEKVLELLGHAVCVPFFIVSFQLNPTTKVRPAKID